MSQTALEDTKVGDTHFCFQPACDLHVIIEAGDGEWAELDNSCIVGRIRIDGHMVCDRCARKLLTPFAFP
jgi:hypothetical protein